MCMLLQWENKDQEKLRIYFSRSDAGKKSNQVTKFCWQNENCNLYACALKKKDNTDQNLKKPFINDFGCFCFMSIITVNCSLCQIFHVKS